MDSPKITPMSFAVHRPKQNPVFDEGVVYVTLQDEGGGPFLELIQHPSTGPSMIIRMDFSDFDVVAQVVKQLKSSFDPKDFDVEVIE